MKILYPDLWPEELDIQFGDNAVRHLCEVFRVDGTESVRGFPEFKDSKATKKMPVSLSPLMKAVETIAISTSECERAFKQHE